jgi:hypothetical protein
MRVQGLLILVLAGSVGQPAMEEAICRPAGPEDTTLLGHMPYTVRTNGEFRVVQGTVVDPVGEPVEGALVEVFDHPEQSSWYGLVEEDGPQHRVAACRTGPSGRYRFDGVPAGHYDLRVGASGFNGALHWIYVNPKGRGRRELVVRLELGT